LLILASIIAVVAFVSCDNENTLEEQPAIAVETPQPEIDLIVDREPELELPAEEILPEELNLRIDAASDELLDTFIYLHQIDLGATEFGEGVTLVLWANRPLANFSVVGLEAHLLEDRNEWGFMLGQNFGYAQVLQPGEAFVINNYMGLGTLPHLGISFTNESGADTKFFFFQENHAYPEHGDRWVIQEIEPSQLIWEIPNERDESADLEEDAVLETENDEIDDDDDLLTDESEALPLPEINFPIWQTVRSGIDPGRPMIALTFDDGPSAHTVPILDALEFYGGVATFYVLGNRLEAHRDIAQRMHAQGSEIANHTWSHRRLTNLSERDMHFEVYNASVAIAEITGFAPASLRPTYGAYNDAVVRVSENLNLPIVLWTLDTRDWYTRNADMIFNSVMDNVRDRDIIIMHDIREPTTDAAVRLIPALIEQGFQLVTVTELFYHSGVTPVPGRIYNFGGGRR